jgi:hypothetical protein
VDPKLTSKGREEAQAVGAWSRANLVDNAQLLLVSPM